MNKEKFCFIVYPIIKESEKIDLNIKKSVDDDIQVVIPAGTFFKSNSIDVQNMISIKEWKVGSILNRTSLQ